MLREIREADEDRLTEISTAGMEYDEFNGELVSEKTIGALDFLPALSLAEESNGTIRGFIQGVFGSSHGKPHGWIRMLVVDPRFRRQGIGSALLVELEKRLRSKGAGTITTMDIPANYLSPGIDWRYTEAYSFLEKHGYFRVGANLNLICDIAAEKFDVSREIAELAKQGYLIKRAEMADREAVVRFLRAAFPFWEDEVVQCFGNSPISLHICIRDGEVLGFSGYQGNNKALQWFGPMGVVPDGRGKGIGAVVCKLCLRDLALQGYKKSIIPWVGPVRFYRKVCDARVDRMFWVWSKELA